ncbi:MAG: protein kinase [Elusimicrobia bacterium]|nr:protein kinase [Elusimicrobiota bacterium]
MKKIHYFLSVFFFLPLFTPALAMSKEEVPGVVAAPVVPGSEIPVVDNTPPVSGQNQAAAITVDPALHENRRDDFRTFRMNASNHPDVSARALARILKGLPPDEAQKFTDRNCFPISEMLTGLRRMADSKNLSHENLHSISSELEPFDIHVFDARGRKPPDRGGPGGPGGRGHDKMNPVNDLVAVRSAVNSEDKKAAEEKVQALTQSYPDNPSVQSAAASYYNEMRNYTMAEKAATTAIKLDEKDPDPYKTRAVARAELEDRKGALEDIKKAMAIDPQDESAKILSILLESRKSVPTLKSLASAEEIKKALGSVEDGSAAAVRGDRDPGGINGAPGQSPAADGGAATSAANGGAGQAQVPDYGKSQAYLQTAFSKTRLGDYGNTVKYATLSIEKNPANTDAYLERANAMNFLGRYDEAVRDATVVLQKDPSNLQALNMRAWALNKKGLSGEAETDSSRAIGINPGFADAWFNRALAYEKQGDYKKTLENFRQAAALSGAYQSRYQDAVAQYGAMVPGFSAGLGAASAGAQAAYEGARRQKRSPLKRFLILLFFTLTGGALVAMGLVHIVTSRNVKAAVSARSTHPDVLSPSVFYEGVATGKYKIERKIGEGGMGVVYEAVDQSLGRKVAIKKMNEEIKVNEREKQRFLEEARTVALLHHPNIVEIYTIFEEEDNIYLVFEYINGLTLDRLLDKEVRLDFAKTVGIFDEVSKALVYAHSKNVIHRDLKLSNIMLSEENEIKVMDFGLASRVRESLARSSNAEVVGSPAYMAPEQDMGVSSREADIYSLGVCLYESLSGVLPFPGPDFHQQKVGRLYQPLSGVVPGSPKALDSLFEKAFAPEPENRFHSAEEFRKTLLDIAEAGGFSPESEERGRAKQGPEYRTFPV